MGLCAKDPFPVKMTSSPFDVIAQWSDQQKSDLLRLLQAADQRVRQKDRMAMQEEQSQEQAQEFDKKREKIEELKKIMCELKETYTKACIDIDYDQVEWVEKQQAAYRRKHPELYDIAQDEIAREAQS